MATPADQRLLELLDKWLKSLELHAKYSSLDDESYWKVQPWMEHQRPSRWIIDLARQKTIALQNQVQERVKKGDSQFSESLELMIFLANLVGSEHIERFIPVADAGSERSLARVPDDTASAGAADSATGTREMPQFLAAKRTSPPAAADTATGTREMPQFLAAKRTPPPAGTAQVARAERKHAVPPKPPARPAVKPPIKPAAAARPAAVAKPGSPPQPKAPPPARTAAKPAPKAAPDRGGAADRAGTSDAAREQVIADAARLVQWGRKWYELPELIARMADRPPLPEVRRYTEGK